MFCFGARYSYSVLLARVVCEEFSDLLFLRHAVPDVIPHKWSDVMARKSDVYSQPVITFA
jgi:hypothetical protein